tara:strand:+ start:384 stop:716 length:333 start_codon:yes stop_codon:yes gene_type:complete
VTDEETRRVLFLLSSIWNQKISDPTLEVWRKRLGGFDDYNAVVESVERLADTSSYWPSIADVVETYKAVTRAYRYHPSTHALPPPKGEQMSRAESLAMLKQCRANLGASG